ncbi:hypothetical protein LUW76_33730 [Actinomadura madurae]|uniref:hypothetical protein n=1 Tax=Actinomadura madurae TaxID=1993 RepID=UPI0020266E3A|nr:hypothetical protein [Actinomadura madurae]URM98895.1 hypothetical protein LUW76_33730 [Actinomadura madurae]
MEDGKMPEYGLPKSAAWSVWVPATPFISPPGRRVDQVLSWAWNSAHRVAQWIEMFFLSSVERRIQSFLDKNQFPETVTKDCLRALQFGMKEISRAAGLPQNDRLCGYVITKLTITWVGTKINLDFRPGSQLSLGVDSLDPGGASGFSSFSNLPREGLLRKLSSLEIEDLVAETRGSKEILQIIIIRLRIPENMRWDCPTSEQKLLNE